MKRGPLSRTLENIENAKVGLKRCSRLDCQNPYKTNGLVPLKHFTRQSNTVDGLYTSCRHCINRKNDDPEVKLKRKKYWSSISGNLEFKKKRKKYQRDRYINDKIFRKKMIDYTMQRRYGISLMEYERILKKQDKKCAICLTNIDTDIVNTDNKNRRKGCVDHNHITGCVRGLLCYKCNTSLGQFHADNGIEFLKRAIEYVLSEVQK